MNFTEQDVKQFLEFRQFVNTKANWQLTSQEAVTLVQHFQFLHGLAQKIEQNIFEVKKVSNPTKAEPSSQPKAGK